MTSTLFAEGSPAKTSASPGAEQDLKANEAVSGSNSIASSKKSSRATRSSKTSQPFAVEDWIKYSGHSLRSGTMRNGTVYPLPPLVPLTAGTESGLWRTPQAGDGERGVYATKETMDNRLAKGGQLSLPNQVKHPHLWPTPTAHNAKEGGYPAEHTRNTPTLSAVAGGKLNPRWVEWLMGFPDNHTDLSN